MPINVGHRHEPTEQNYSHSARSLLSSPVSPAKPPFYSNALFYGSQKPSGLSLYLMTGCLSLLHSLHSVPFFQPALASTSTTVKSFSGVASSLTHQCGLPPDLFHSTQNFSLYSLIIKVYLAIRICHQTRLFEVGNFTLA